MTEIVDSSSQKRQQNPSMSTGPLTRSAMSAARSGGGAGSLSAPLPPPSHPSQAMLRGPITRKRAASINTEEANTRQKIHSLNITTPNSASPRPFDAGGSQLICLCAPEPKVPRPRNGMFFWCLYSFFLFPLIFNPHPPCLW